MLTQILDGLMLFDELLVTLVVTSEIKTPVVKVEITTDCKIIHGLYLLRISQVKHLVFKMEVGRCSLFVLYLARYKGEG